MKFFTLMLLSLSILAGGEYISKVKKYEIEGRIHPIKVYEACIDGITYLIIVDGYKAGMSPKFKNNKDTGIPVVETCKTK